MWAPFLIENNNNASFPKTKVQYTSYSFLSYFYKYIDYYVYYIIFIYRE